ncbi:hypothetical protein [Nocardia flavorosea]|uniref:hypothetical protein n=1 Tax=Nocardia flavorosea TaxID=53429 RepID=UPI0007A41B8C|nr:hypothetical protein [Nocardia flavorosea]
MTDQRNAVEIVGNVHAMQTAIDLDGRLDEELILAIHAALMAGPRSRFRRAMANSTGMDRRR